MRRLVALRRLSPALRRGQATVEYSFVAHAILLAGSIGVWTFWDTLMKALNLYFESIYFVITSAVP
jgi:hypothetical protein